MTTATQPTGGKPAPVFPPEALQVPDVPLIVRIGVTGHRQLSDKVDVKGCVTAIFNALDEAIGKVPHLFHVITPLAVGADRLILQALKPAEGERLGDTYEVVLPFAEQDYCTHQQFDETLQDEFDAFKQGALDFHELPGKASAHQESFEKLGQYITDNCDVLIAIWDGVESPQAKRGGTEDIVNYAKHVRRFIYWINANTGEIRWFGPDTREPDGLPFDAGSAARLGVLQDSLRAVRTYRGEHVNDAAFRREVATRFTEIMEHTSPYETAKIDAALVAPSIVHFLPHQVRATLLATKYQRYHRYAGTALYLFAPIAVAAIAWYAELHETEWLLGLEILLMAVTLGVLALAYLCEWHRRWIDYRFLAEQLRVAQYLSLTCEHCTVTPTPPYVGSAFHPDEWMVRGVHWIWNAHRQVSCARLSAGQDIEPLKEFLNAAWLNGQAEFYRERSHRFERRSRWLEFAGYALFALTLIAALIHTLPWSHHQPTLPEVLTVIALAMPTLAASVAGIRAYHEYSRNAERYAHMGNYLRVTGEKLRRATDGETLTTLLEEINEVMLREHQEWRMVVRNRKMEAV